MSIKIKFKPAKITKTDGTVIKTVEFVEGKPQHIELEWLETTGKQGFAVDTKPSNNLSIEMRFIATVKNPGQTPIYYPCGFYQADARYRPLKWTKGRVNLESLGTGTEIQTELSQALNNEYIVKYNIDGLRGSVTNINTSEYDERNVHNDTYQMKAEVISTAYLGICAQTHSLYAPKDGELGQVVAVEGNYLMPLKFKSLKTKNYYSDTLIGDYIPVLKNGTPCIYNKISKRYFYPQGTNIDEITYKIKET